MTSAETVLLEHQSTAEFLSKLAEPGTTVVVSLSPQSRAALAAFYGLPPGAAQRRLAGFLKGLGVRAVLDASAGRDFALLEAAAEFVARYRAAHPEHSGAPLGALPNLARLLPPDLTLCCWGQRPSSSRATGRRTRSAAVRHLARCQTWHV